MILFALKNEVFKIDENVDKVVITARSLGNELEEVFHSGNCRRVAHENHNIASANSLKYVYTVLQK